LVGLIDPSKAVGSVIAMHTPVRAFTGLECPFQKLHRDGRSAGAPHDLGMPEYRLPRRFLALVNCSVHCIRLYADLCAFDPYCHWNEHSSSSVVNRDVPVATIKRWALREETSISLHAEIPCASEKRRARKDQSAMCITYMLKLYLTFTTI
jgi:hypothetical protein